MSRTWGTKVLVHIRVAVSVPRKTTGVMQEMKTVAGVKVLKERGTWQ